MNRKICSKCKKSKSVGEFTKLKSSTASGRLRDEPEMAHRLWEYLKQTRCS